MPPKIGLLTFHRTSNFGSMLQTYSLYKKIIDLGFECEIIDYRCPAIESREHLSEDKAKHSIKEIAKEILVYPTMRRKSNNLSLYLSNKAKLSSEFTPDTIKSADKMYDKFIVGSDIVWGRDITNYDYTYFLDFVSNKQKKYAFSSSVGTSCLEPDDKLSEVLSDFSRIAVREMDAVKWVNYYSKIGADFVCDPTMLLTREQWDEESRPSKRNGKYALIYFTDDDGKCINDAMLYAKHNHLKVLYINYGLPRRGVKNTKPDTISEFIGLIKNAEIVFTASYHGMLFSMYYQKQFLYYTRAHKERMESLAHYLGVNDHCGDNYDVMHYKKVDYDYTTKQIEEFRQSSTEILRGMLNE